MKLLITMRSGRIHEIWPESVEAGCTAQKAAEAFYDAGFKLGKLDTMYLDRFIFNPMDIESIEFIDDD